VKRTVLLLTSLSAALVLASGAALALNTTGCDGDRQGTRYRDEMLGSDRKLEERSLRLRLEVGREFVQQSLLLDFIKKRGLDRVLRHLAAVFTGEAQCVSHSQ